MSNNSKQSKFSCILCRKEFSILGFSSHIRLHYNSHRCSCLICKNEYTSNTINNHFANTHSDSVVNIETKKQEEYVKSAPTCKYCNAVLPYQKRHNKFCNASCSATYNNSIVDRTKFTPGPLKKIKVPETLPQFSKLVQCKCKHCGIQWKSRLPVRYCSNHQELYSHNGRAKYWFTFNVFHYPDLFDLSLISNIGFRNSKTNPNGITRDHRLSVNDAIRNNYDPYYIKHPLNCELMPFDQNNKKKTKSSISYEDLVNAVNLYDGVSGGDSNPR